jgi:hypothetical protein
LVEDLGIRGQGLRVGSLGIGDEGLGFLVADLSVQDQGLEIRKYRLGIMVQGCGCRFECSGSGIRDYGLGIRDWGLGMMRVENDRPHRLDINPVIARRIQISVDHSARNAPDKRRLKQFISSLGAPPNQSGVLGHCDDKAL